MRFHQTACSPFRYAISFQSVKISSCLYDLGIGLKYSMYLAGRWYISDEVVRYTTLLHIQAGTSLHIGRRINLLLSECLAKINSSAFGLIEMSFT